MSCANCGLSVARRTSRVRFGMACRLLGGRDGGLRGGGGSVIGTKERRSNNAYCLRLGDATRS